jgi:hypothetical protein
LKYVQTAIPLDAPHGLRAWLADQLRQIANALATPSVNSVAFDILHEAPAHLATGTLIFADGTDWNPGSGAGLYEYRGGAWHKL